MLLSLALLLPAISGGSQLAVADETALWDVVHYLCVPHQQQLGRPWPCEEVALDSGVQNGYAVLSDITNETQVLVVPTARISGIESPAILASDATNYWQAAWQARKYVVQRARKPIPREDIGLAINSVESRSQDQLHIHIDCLRQDVKQALASHQSEIQSRWAKSWVNLAGRRYLAMKVEGETLGTLNPFKLLASLPSASANMGQETLVVVGAVFRSGNPGFYILADRTDAASGDLGHGEELLDHTCAVLEKAQ